MFKHLLVPTDGSQLSQDTVGRALSFAREANARISFVCVEQHFPTMYLGMGAISDAHAARQFHDSQESVAQAILARCQALADEAGVAADTLAIASDEPYEAIIGAAERLECDLIFMASHGHRGIKAILLGSQTQKVLTHTSIPVLVYR